MKLGPISCDSDYQYGIWWLRVGSVGLQLKAPWNKPLFSERHQVKKPIATYKGWRLFNL